jgi:hypothetical protein
MDPSSAECTTDTQTPRPDSGKSASEPQAADPSHQHLEKREPVRLDSTGELYAGPTVTISLLIENTYELYDDVTVYQSNAVIPAPPDPETEPDLYDEWKYLHIYCFTGVGHEDGDSWYDVTVLDCSDPELVGQEFDFGY